MRRIYGTFRQRNLYLWPLQKQTRNKRRTVFIITPLLEGFVILQIVPGVFQNTVDRNDAFRHEIAAGKPGCRRNVRIIKLKLRMQFLMQIPGSDRRSRSAADDMLSFFCKRTGTSSFTVIPVGRRPDDKIHGLAAADAHGADRSVVPGFPSYSREVSSINIVESVLAVKPT